MTPTNPCAPNSSDLDRAAALCQIEPEYWDTWGQRHPPSEQTIQAVVRSLGEGVSVADFIAQQERRPWEDGIPPSLLIRRNDPVKFAVRLPAHLAGAPVRFRFQPESGEASQFEWTLPADASRHNVQGSDYVMAEYELPLKPECGYHGLTLVTDSREIPMRLIVALPTAYLPPFLQQGGKTAGVAVSLYGVRSARNWGCGDFTDLHGLLSWLAEDLGASFLALNPLHAIENRQPYNISPYLPNSIFFRNPIYLDVEAIAEIQASPAAQRLLASEGVQQEIASCRSAEFVEYERVWRLKRFFLKLGFRQFLRTGGHSAFEAYRQEQGERLEQFSTYCALWDWMHRRNPDLWTWRQWPEAYQNPASAEVAAFRQTHARQILFYAYVQWQVDVQLKAAQDKAKALGMPIGLYHDMALATDRCGADLWANRPFFVDGCRVGSPPDGFAPEGQDWGFPPPNTFRNRADGYRMFVDSIRASSRHGGALRIDHVMRLFRLYWIPDGLEAKDGAYVRDFADELMAILALESVRNQFLIVGEDLGTVGPDMRRQLYEGGILSYKVLYFEKDETNGFLRPEQYARQALAASTTHDLPTLAGYWTNRDIETRREAGLLGSEEYYHRQLRERAEDKQCLLNLLHELRLVPDWFPRDQAQVPDLTGELHNAIIGFLCSTPSILMVLNQEDLTKETEQQNLPASTYQYPNWKRKMKYSVEELRSLPIARDFALMLRTWLTATGRSAS